MCATSSSIVYDSPAPNWGTRDDGRADTTVITTGVNDKAAPIALSRATMRNRRETLAFTLRHNHIWRGIGGYVRHHLPRQLI